MPIYGRSLYSMMIFYNLSQVRNGEIREPSGHNVQRYTGPNLQSSISCSQKCLKIEHFSMSLSNKYVSDASLIIIYEMGQVKLNFIVWKTVEKLQVTMTYGYHM